MMFLEHEALYGSKGDVPEGKYTTPIGKANVKKEGKDITIITYSRMVVLAIKAAQELEKVLFVDRPVIIWFLRVKNVCMLALKKAKNVLREV